MEQIKAWIYCRINPNTSRSLLYFQNDQLEEIAEKCNMEVIGHTHVISDGKYLNSYEMKTLIIEIKQRNFDVLLINSPMRISIYPDIFEEFELLCRLYNVRVLSYIDYINS